MCPCRGHSPGATRGWAVGFALGLKKGGGATPMLADEELKTRLGTYLRRVRDGQRILVTDRGIPVAELRGVGAGRETREGRLQRLEAAGLVSRPSRALLEPLRAVRSSGDPAAQAVVEDREDRF